jgi:hypothetical protein
MDSADEDIARLDSKVTSARDSLPGAYGHTIRVFRPSPWRIVPRRRRPTMIVWTALDGRQHQLPFLWFRRNEVPSIIAAVQRL